MRLAVSRFALNLLLSLALVLGAAQACSASGDAAAIQAAQLAQYEADAPKTILELQPFRRSSSIGLVDSSGRRGTATLVELNPNINSWFLLRLDLEGVSEPQVYHLENADPRGVHVSLDEGNGGGLRINSAAGDASCSLWSDHAVAQLEAARRQRLPYVPLCAGQLYLRNPVSGTYTHLEEVTNFLRDHVWGGDRIVNFVKEQLLQDQFAEKGARAPAGAAAPGTPAAASGPAGSTPAAPAGPAAAQLDTTAAGATIVPAHLGLNVAASGPALTLGAWYPINSAPGIYVSVIQPSAVADSILKSFRTRVSNLDAVESNAVDYLVAFDLAEFDLGFALGTDHPRVDWAGRELAGVHDERLAGPDGIGTSGPLIRNGMVSPAVTARTAATFAGGFKREHSAFRYGALALQNHGSHYGFIEQGVVFSKLQPGLATVYGLDDGSIGMKTWTRGDDGSLPRLRFARQNGVPLLESSGAPAPGIPASTGVPGLLVTQWGAGNWSGSADEKFRTLRAGLCVQSSGARPGRPLGQRFLIYGYFSTATPSAMVRVFQAYGCQYAMHLDMNALEHTYMAVYTRQGGQLLVQHLVEGMGEVDRKGGGELAPRFLGFPDDRDFFYLVRRRAVAADAGAAAR